MVPQSTIGKSAGWCFDIRTAQSRTTACFTKSYASYIKGTGSVLLMLPPGAVHCPSAEASTLLSTRAEDQAVTVGSKRQLDSDNARCSEADAAGVTATNTESSSCSNSNSESRNVPGERVFDEAWWPRLVQSHCAEGMTEQDKAAIRLRFFSPRELTRLFGFPESFRFPPAVARKKQYEMVGNSLSVVVAGRLLHFLLSGGGESDQSGAVKEHSV